MGKTNLRHKARVRRKAHIRKAVRGTTLRPRLSVFRSANHIYAQVIDDTSGRTLVSASTTEGKKPGGNCQAAAAVGQRVAERAIEAGIKEVSFDRGRFGYHGRVATLADAAREAGLSF